jgi:hypothetical protein
MIHRPNNSEETSQQSHSAGYLYITNIRIFALETFQNIVYIVEYKLIIGEAFQNVDIS